MPRTTELKVKILHSGLTQIEVAERVGLSQPAFNLIVNGHRQPTNEQAREISRVLRTPQKDLFGERRNEPAI